MHKISAIVLAAGNGTRFGQKKQFAEFNGMPIWEIVKAKTSIVIEEVIVIGVDIPGGISRKDSVFVGLNEVSGERVVILEAARPAVATEQINKIAEDPHPSCTYYMPSVETVIYNDLYLDRKNCTVFQTPQAFDRKLLIEAHNSIKSHEATDDTYLMRVVHGIAPKLLEGGANLHKITYKEDIHLLPWLQ